MLAARFNLAGRLIIGLALLVLLAVLLDYLAAWRRRAQALKNAPQILSTEMARSVDQIEYSDNRDGVLRFRIRARRLLESRLGKSYLQGIEACDFNPDGSVRNEIRSEKAEYVREHGLANFSGDVRLFFSKGIELRTESLGYDFNGSVGETNDPVQFVWSQAGGKARGVRFDQRQGKLEFKSDVDFELSQKRRRPDGRTEEEVLHARSARAHAYIDARRIFLQGNVRLESASADLHADSAEAALSTDGKQLTSLVAEGRAFCRFKEPNNLRQFSGRRIVFGIGDSGYALETVDVLGEAELSSQSSSGEEYLSGGMIRLRLDPAKGLPARMQGKDGVRFRTGRGTEQTLISAEHLSADFIPGTNIIEALQIHGQGRLTLGSATGESIHELEAEEINISFRRAGEKAAFEKLRASGSARWTLKPTQAKAGAPQNPARALEASLLEMFFPGEGAYPDSGRASGKVIVSEPADEKSVSPQVRRLAADEARFYFFPGSNRLSTLRAQGNVRIVYERHAAAGIGAMPDRFQTESEKMEALFNLVGGESRIRSLSQQGNFRYRDALRTATAGRSNYDAGRELLVLEDHPGINAENLGTTTGERIEFDQKQNLLQVYRSVRSRLGSKGGAVSPISMSAPSPTIITADELRYWLQDGRARYSGNVRLLSESAQLQAEVLDIAGGGLRVEAHGDIRHMVFIGETSKREKNPADLPMIIKSSALSYLKKSNTITYTGNASLYSKDFILYSAHLEALLDEDGKKIAQARAQGQVRIHQGVRECKGDMADYYLEPGKFVIVGNPAEIVDPGKGRSFARRLTSFVANDRILIDKQ